MRLFLSAVVWMLASTGFVSAQSARAGATASFSGDGALQLPGVWSCKDFASGSFSTQEYMLRPNGSLLLRIDVHASTGATGSVSETLRFDATTRTWSLAAERNRFFDALRLDGPTWNDATWTLTGTEIVLGRAREVRILYTDLGPDAFRREHQIRDGAAWKNDAEYECRRTAPVRQAGAAPSPVPSGSTPTAVPRVAAQAGPPRRPPPPPPKPAVSRTSSPPPVAAPPPTPTVRSTPGTEPPRISASSPSPRPSASPRPSPSPRRSPAPRPSSSGSPRTADRVYSLIGRWACETIARDSSTHTYSRLPDGGLALRNELRIGTHTFEIDERYSFDAKRQQWRNETEHGAYRGTAGRWLAGNWTFEGIDTELGAKTPVRMVYMPLGDGAFRRDFLKLRGGSWTTYASETCARIER